MKRVWLSLRFAAKVVLVWLMLTGILAFFGSALVAAAWIAVRWGRWLMAH